MSNGTPLLARKDAISSNEKLATKGLIVNKHAFVKLAGGTIPLADWAITSSEKVLVFH